MSLEAGARLGAYQIVAPLGRGGMGEVYRARDGRLDRDVALKILPDGFAGDPERLARLQREARLLASLNHPNVAHVYDLQEADGTTALAMELVDGPTLADRIAEGPLALEEAVLIARQVAEAIEAAHERGVVHRDLKPGNVKVRADGTVKVLDFGLAKAIDATSSKDVSQSPTITSPAMTRAGMILGTAAYMSPEQAKGRAADKRSDIWAWGCVLFEMLTARRAFPGNDVAETLAKVIEREPDFDRLPATTPDAVRRVLRRCLTKDHKTRLADIADVQPDLLEALTEPAAALRAASQRRVRSTVVPWVAGVVIGGALALGLALWLMGDRRNQGSEVRRLTIVLPSNAATNATFDAPSGFALSPDGSEMVYVATVGGRRQLYRRTLDQLEVRPIPGTESATQPFFSPDGQWIAFFSFAANQRPLLKKVSLQGGPPQTLCAVARPAGGSWGVDDAIVFASSQTDSAAWSLFRVRATGGTPELLATPDAGANQLRFAWPQLLPEGRNVLFSVSTSVASGDDDFSEAYVAVLSLDTKELRRVVDDGYFARYLPSGHIVYMSGGVLLAVPFDVGRLQASGSPVPIQEGIATSEATGATAAAFAEDGTFMYIQGTDTRRLPAATPAWVRAGDSDLRPIMKDPVEGPRYLSLSPDGQRLVMGVGPDNQSSLWVYDLSGRPPTPLTHGGHNLDPFWTRDGTRIAFSSNRDGVFNLYWIAADGSELEPERLITSTRGQFGGSWSVDDRDLLFWESRGQPRRADILAMAMDDTRTVRDVIASEYAENAPRLSPDGRWLAYQSDVTGRQEVWVRPFPGPGAPVPVSLGGGAEPAWSADGSELFFLETRPTQGTCIMGARLLQTKPIRFSPPRVRVERVFVFPGTNGFFDVAPDGRFLVLQPADTSTRSSETTSLVIVLNWLNELAERAPVS